ncbi:formylmethanofuran dehydrogenase subunit E family protein [Candidatus Hydrogenedentota bacterium]
MRVMFIATAMLLAVCVCGNVLGHKKTDTGGREEKGERPLHILKIFPLNAEAYQEQAAELVKAGVPEKFGHEEWAAVVMAHELHQHVGIMTVVGAKMGVRAREILDAPTRSIRVTVETGASPPSSCVIDGIQASIGSTLAQDLITVPKTEKPEVAATFEYKGRKVRLSLEPEYKDKIQRCIKSAIEEHGNLTSAYFHEIEHFSYYVWSRFDRREIFVAQLEKTQLEKTT